MKVKFWGTRGSLAKPGPSTIRYGGNTSCVEVVADDGTILILDCGTGAHELGQQLVQSGPVTGNLLISHTHWDHIQGIPFFAPFFVQGSEWDIYAPQGFGETLRTTLAGQMEYTYFPITADAFGAALRYHNVSEGEFRIGNVLVKTRFLNHPALTIAYRIEADGAAVVYACDHEPHAREAAQGGGALHGQDKLHADFLAGADLVIHDAQYVAAEYSEKRGWGHSTIEYAVKACEQGGAQRLAFTHHDPMRDDAAVDELIVLAEQVKDPALGLEIIGAAEGMVFELRGEIADPIAPTIFQLPVFAARGGRTALVVTGDPALVERVRSPLHEEGLTLIEANSIEAALSLCQADRCPIILIDAGLARGTIAMLTEMSIETPVLILGGEDDPAFPANVERVSATFSPEYLRSRLRTWLLRGKFADIPASMPEGEAKRLAAVRSLKLLDTPAEDRFDRFTRMAARLLDVPTSLITLVDEERQWFKSKVGLHLSETPRGMSFCARAILETEPLIVRDALTDDRFSDNPLVTGPPRIRFYAGIPISVMGEKVGTLCLIDSKPQDPSPEEIRLLQDIAELVEQELMQAPPLVATSTSMPEPGGSKMAATPPSASDQNRA